MNITFDSTKDDANRLKHGVSLSLAIKLEWDLLLTAVDIRNDYGECRMVGYAPINDRVYCVVYVDRDQQRRIISLRKANKREVTSYANKINS
jgi:hypothetical protein